MEMEKRMKMAMKKEVKAKLASYLGFREIEHLKRWKVEE